MWAEHTEDMNHQVHNQHAHSICIACLLGITVTQRLCTISTSARKTPRFGCPSPSTVTKQCSWTPRLHWEHELVTPHSLPRQLLPYNELGTSTKLPIDCVVVEAEAAWDCGGCCGEAAVGGFNENSKPLRGLEFLAARSICTCCRVEGAPSALTWQRAAAGVANSCHSADASCLRTHIT